MKTLTVSQPRAMLITLGLLQTDTMPWGSRHRGPLAIHAGALCTGDVDKLLSNLAACTVLGEAFGCDPQDLVGLADRLFDVPSEGVVATADLVDCVTLRSGIESYTSAIARSILDYTPGRIQWFFSKVKPVNPPVPAIGAPGLWEWAPPARER